MNYLIKTNTNTPAYMQLYHYFVHDIVTGTYPEGTKLPSKRIVAADTGVSVITVQHAFDLLCEEGYVEARQRSGYFVLYNEKDFQTMLDISMEDYREKTASAHKVGEFPYSVMAKTMRRVILDYGEQLLIKSPNFGLQELRQEISRYLERSRGIQVKPSQIIIGSGSEYLYGLIAQLLGTEKTFALENPSYDKIRQVYETLGVKCDMLLLTKDGILSSELEKTKASVLHVTPFNSYPSGVTITISKKKEYLRWAMNRNCVIVEDNYESELTISSKPDNPIFNMSDGVRVIYLNSFSKTIAPSMRIGYMVLPQELIDSFQKKLGFYSCTVPVFEQLLLCELIRTGDLERHINRVRRKKRKLMKEKP